MAIILPLYNPEGTIIGYVMPDPAVGNPGVSSLTPKAAPVRRKATKTSRLHDRRVKAAVAYVTERTGMHGVTFVARVLACETAFKGLSEGTIKQFLYKLVAAGTISKTDDGFLICPPVPDDASSLAADVEDEVNS